jgi:hypothetical protein
MEREWTCNVRRLSEADRAEIERRIQDGEAFATIAGLAGRRGSDRARPSPEAVQARR